MSIYFILAFYESLLGNNEANLTYFLHNAQYLKNNAYKIRVMIGKQEIHNK